MEQDFLVCIDAYKEGLGEVFVDVYVTSECILLCILCIVTQCLLRDVSIMYLGHVVIPRCFDRED